MPVARAATAEWYSWLVFYAEQRQVFFWRICRQARRYRPGPELTMALFEIPWRANPSPMLAAIYLSDSPPTLPFSQPTTSPRLTRPLTCQSSSGAHRVFEVGCVAGGGAGHGNDNVTNMKMDSISFTKRSTLSVEVQCSINGHKAFSRAFIVLYWGDFWALTPSAATAAGRTNGMWVNLEHQCFKNVPLPVLVEPAHYLAVLSAITDSW